MPITLSKSQASDYKARIEQDWRGDLDSHQARRDRNVEALRRWRNRVEPPPAGEESASNIQVPLIQWQTYGKWARLVAGIFGNDAEVVAKPVGPSDQAIVHKVGRFETWRVFQNARMMDPLCVGLFRVVLFGRSHWYAPWSRDEYWIIDQKTGKKRKALWYEGPDLISLPPDDIVVPPEDARTVHDFSHVIRKFRTTPAALLRGEKEHRYFGIRDKWDSIEGFAKGQGERESEGDDVKVEQDESEGVERQNTQTATRNSLAVWEWYGYGEPNRYGEQQELMLHYLPEVGLLIGAKDLMELYPRSRYRRPFCEVGLVKDGSYWCPGAAELLESVEDELSANENLFTEAAQYSIGPFLLYKPASGFKPKRMEYAPFTAEPCEDPNGVKIVQPQVQPQGYVLKQQSQLAISERVWGLSDQAMGRSIDRPNAPRTFGGQVALIEQGNIRVALDLNFVRQDLGAMLRHFWELESQFTPASVFFRVTEEDAKGLFPVTKGGATMTDREFAGRYDFDVRFADSVWSKEAKKERQLQLYQLDLLNPLVAQNPRALWWLANQIHKAMGDDNFADVIPEPPDLGLPKNPREEWTLALEGEDIPVNPADNDDLHLLDHTRRVRDALQDAPEDRDEDAIQRMVHHIIDHQKQKQAKVMMAALTEKLAQGMGQVLNAAQPGMAAAGGEGGAPTDPIAQVMQMLGGQQAVAKGPPQMNGFFGQPPNGPGA